MDIFEAVSRLREAAGMPPVVMDADDVEWMTVNGARIPIKNGAPQNEVGKKILGDEGGSPEKKSGRSRGSAPVTELRGSELGQKEGETIKDAAHRYYETLRKDPADREGFGKVEFTRVGLKKLDSSSLPDQERLKLLPAVKPIIQNGDYIGRSELTKERKDGIVAFHYFEGNVKVGNETKFVGVSVGEDKFSRKFYNLTESPDALLAKKKAQGSSGEKDLSPAPFGDAADSADCILNIIVARDAGKIKEKDMNLFHAINRLRHAAGMPPAKWDVRASSMDDQWITMNGAHVLLGEGGEVKAGAGGKFNGQKIGGTPKPTKETSAEKDVRRSAKAKEFKTLSERADHAFSEYSKVQEEYITKLGEAKRGEKGKIKQEYEPQLKAAERKWGSAIRERNETYADLAGEITKGWGGVSSATVQNREWPRFLSGEIERYAGM